MLIGPVYLDCIDVLYEGGGGCSQVVILGGGIDTMCGAVGVVGLPCDMLAIDGARLGT